MADSSIPTEGKESKTSNAQRKSWIGAAWGELIGGVTGGVATIVAGAVHFSRNNLNPLDPQNRSILNKFSIIGYAGTLGGIVAGYLLGKKSGEKRDKQEQETGQTPVEPPRFWNWKAAQGYVIGALSSLGLGTAVSMVFSNKPFIQRRAAQSVASWAGTAMTLGGFIYGGIKGKQQMREEYNQRTEEIAKAESGSPIASQVNTSQTAQQEPKNTDYASQMKRSNSKEQAFTSAEDERRTAPDSPRHSV